MPTPLITLTTDFGEGSPYVAQMKAVAISIRSDLRLIDITHSIAPQDVCQGAIVLADVVHHFPPGTLHVCVVDPGVGTARKIVYAELGEQRFVAPDNGLLSLIAQSQTIGELRSIESPQFRRPGTSATFHGRDIMVPAAAYLSLGVLPSDLGPRLPDLTKLDWPEVDRQPHSLVGRIVWIDHFGNLSTNITRDMLPENLAAEALSVTCGSSTRLPVVQTYGDAPAGSLLALFGSSDRLEIAVTDGNAAQSLGCRGGEPVNVRW